MGAYIAQDPYLIPGFREGIPRGETFAQAIEALRDISLYGWESLPWTVLGFVDAEGVPTLRIHFLRPIHPNTMRIVRAQLPMVIRAVTRFSFSERAPLCTVHPDCWEGGEEMRRDCYAGIAS